MFNISYQTKEIPEYCKRLVLEEARKFAYNPQLPLFPDPEVEEARIALKEFLESGGTIEFINVQLTDKNKYGNLEGIVSLGFRKDKKN